MRQEIKATRACAELAGSQRDHWIVECRKLKSQLAERDALLHEIAYSPNVFAREFRAKVEALLAASAEASAPACCTPTAEENALLANGDFTPEELWGGSGPTCPKCIKLNGGA